MWIASLSVFSRSQFSDSAGTPTKHVKVRVLHRVAAKMIDLGVVVALGALLRFHGGPFLGFFYSLAADGINLGPWRGQSIGKKIIKLRVINTKRHAPANLRDSLLRNAPVGVATFFAIIPVWGWLILGLVGIPLMVMEIYLMVSLPDGHRLGDVMGETEVVEVEHEPQAHSKESA